MKTTKQYPIVCPSCYGSCVIPEPFLSSTQTTRRCPACYGSGTIIVTETIETNDPVYKVPEKTDGTF